MRSLVEPAGQMAELRVANLLQFAVLSPSEVAAFAAASDLTVAATVVETVELVAVASAASKLASAGCQCLTAVVALDFAVEAMARYVAATAVDADVASLRPVAAATHLIAQQVVDMHCFLQRKLELRQQLQLLPLVLMLQFGPDY